jgi:hypothetical protein
VLALVGVAFDGIERKADHFLNLYLFNSPGAPFQATGSRLSGESISRAFTAPALIHCSRRRPSVPIAWRYVPMPNL